MDARPINQKIDMDINERKPGYYRVKMKGYDYFEISEWYLKKWWIRGQHYCDADFIKIIETPISLLPIPKSDLEDKLCQYCSLEKKGVYGTDGGYMAGCEGSKCDEAYDNYIESFNPEPPQRITREDLIRRAIEYLKTSYDLTIEDIIANWDYEEMADFALSLSTDIPAIPTDNEKQQSKSIHYPQRHWEEIYEGDVYGQGKQDGRNEAIDEMERLNK